MIEDFRLKVFVSVCHTGSFTKTAKNMGISQPAVSHNIAELEKSLQVRLFDRMRGEMILTKAGVVLLRQAQKVLEAYNGLNAVFPDSSSDLWAGRHTIYVYMAEVLESLLKKALPELVTTLRPALKFELTRDVESADVRLLAATNKKDVGLVLETDVISADAELSAFFRQILDYCLSDAL